MTKMKTARVDKLLGSPVDSPPATVQIGLVRTRNAVLALFISLVMMTNLAYRPDDPVLELPSPLLRLTEALRLSQHWDLFSPAPPFNGRFDVVVTDGSGKAVEVFSGPPTMDHPELGDFPSHRWRMLMISSLFAPFDLVRLGVVRGLATRVGIKDLQGQRVDYTFQVRQVDADGRLQAPVDWALWRSDDSH